MAALALALAASSCGLPTYDPLGLREPVAGPTGCRQDLDCPGAFCLFATGQCVACRSKSDCADPAFACVEGTCKRRADACAAAVNCVTPPDDCHVAQGTCEAATATCAYALKGASELCNDGSSCTVDDRCDGFGHCLPGAARSCDDAKSCTTDTCNPAAPVASACVHTAVADELSCGTHGEVCRGGTCQCGNATTETDCADGSDNDCDGKTDCEDVECGLRACNDGNKCTTGEVCSSGACSGTPTVCTPPNTQCYAAAASCDPETGDCVFSQKAAGAGCDDGNPCTEGDSCSAGGTCAGLPKVCNTPPGDCFEAAGTCNASGACTYAPKRAGEACTDKDACTLGDKCNGSGDCKPAEAVICETSPGACSEKVGQCDPNSGACTYKLRAKGFTCRPAADLCDLAETCDGETAVCPDNALQPAGFACHPKAGPCDLEERCSGTSASCPPDRFDTSGLACRPAVGTCDVTESCRGDSALCPPDNLVLQGTTCRPANANGCDVAEICDGRTGVCPVDGFRANGFECRPSLGLCDVAETCPGGSSFCPADTVRPNGFECRAAAGTCDAPELCNGSSNACPNDVLRPSSFKCAPGVQCRKDAFCTGTSTICPLGVPQGDGFCGCGAGLSCKSGNCVTALAEISGQSPQRCQNGLDDDCDGAIDCSDPGCLIAPLGFCAP